MPRARAHGTSTKREAILAAAAELLLAQGYDATSMDAVAAKAGVSKTTVYAHFADKLALFHAVMSHTAAAALDMERTISTLDEHDSVARLVSALYEVVRSATQPELIAFFRVLIAEREHREQLRGMLEESRIEGGAPSVTSMLAPLLQTIADERGVELVDPQQWVVVLLRLSASALQFDMLTVDFTPSDDLLRRHVELVVEIFVRGAFAAPGGVARVPVGYEAYPWGPVFEQ